MCVRVMVSASGTWVSRLPANPSAATEMFMVTFKDDVLRGFAAITMTFLPVVHKKSL